MTRNTDGDELLFVRNPNGGRPMNPGQTVFQGSDSVDIQGIREETTLRFHLGYCSKCGTRIVMGQTLAERLAETLSKKGIGRKEARPPLSLRLAKRLIDFNKRKAEAR